MRSALCALTMLLAACTGLNDIEQDCKSLPRAKQLAVQGFVSGVQPVARLRSGDLLTFFRSGGPASKTGSTIDATYIDPRRLAMASSCAPGELARAIALDGSGVDYGPSVAFAPDAPYVGALAYGRQAASASTGSQLRAAFLSPDGCSMVTQDAVATFVVDTLPTGRLLTDPLVVHLREDTFAAFWTSRALSFDDRIRARLIRPSERRFAANYVSGFGDAIDIDIADRALGVSFAVAITLPVTKERRIALLWNQQTNVIVTTKMVLLDESLAIASPVVELGSDDNEEPDPGMRSISASYDEASGTLAVVWNRGQNNVSQIVGRNMLFKPEIELGDVVSLSSFADGAAFAPFVTLLPRQRFFVVWRTPDAIMGLSVRHDMKRNFDAYACGTESYSLAKHLDVRATNPSVVVSSNEMVVLYDRVTGDGAQALSTLGGLAVPLDGMFPGD